MSSKRLLNVYDIRPEMFGNDAELLDPETTLGTGTYVTAIGFVVLKLREELNVTKVAGVDAVKMAQEAACESMRRVWLRDGDGAELVKELSTQDGTAEMFYAKLHPKLRQLVIGAYGEIHQPTAGQARDFFTSRRTVAA